MGLKALVLPLLNVVSAFRLKRALTVATIGRGSKAMLWRVSPSAGAEFRVGDDCLVSTNIVFERPNAKVDVGDRTFIGGKGVFSVCSSVIVGSDVMISWGCTITDHDSHSLRFSERSSDVVNYIRGEKDWTHVAMAPVRIGNKVWMGFNCSVLKGVTIGEGAVIAANSNVTRDVAPWTLVAGNPARVIRQLPPE